MTILEQINAPAPKNFMMLCLQGEDSQNESCEIHVALRGGKIIQLDDFEHEIKIVKESEIAGWGEALNGPAYEIAPVNGVGKTYVPQREWNRILAGKHSRE